MLIDKLKSDIEFAVRSRSELASSLLKIVLGDCQLKNDFSDEFIVKTCRKLIESNTETIKLSKGRDEVSLTRQNELLRDYVPSLLNEAEVQIYSDQISIEILDAKSEGQAIGCLMRHLKGLGLNTSGEIAKESVKKIRGVKV